MGPRALSGSFTTRSRCANEREKHYCTRLMAGGEFVAVWYAGKVS
jgi:hypothetical protein